MYQSGRGSETCYPFISVIVPVYNERDIIEVKLANLKALDYSPFEIICVDGGSTDGTWEILQHYWDAQVCFTSRNKICQLNYGLALAKGKIIVSTDVDGLMRKDCLRRIAEAFQDPRIGVVGAWVYPVSSYWLEQLYWHVTNKIRVLTGHSVVGTCCAWRREMLDKFPPHVIAEDIYISQVARKKGMKTVYSRTIQVGELKVPGNFQEFWRFRLRRWRAYWKLKNRRRRIK